jgi:hypothetical protein
MVYRGIGSLQLRIGELFSKARREVGPSEWISTGKRSDSAARRYAGTGPGAVCRIHLNSATCAKDLWETATKWGRLVGIGELVAFVVKYAVLA